MFTQRRVFTGVIYKRCFFCGYEIIFKSSSNIFSVIIYLRNSKWMLNISPKINVTKSFFFCMALQMNGILDVIMMATAYITHSHSSSISTRNENFSPLKAFSRCILAISTYQLLTYIRAFFRFLLLDSKYVFKRQQCDVSQF